MADVLTLIHDSALATALRDSHWASPAVGAGHVLGIALLFGGVLPLDLRLLGLWRDIPLASLQRVLVPVALSGLALALCTGLLLFSVSPAKYAGMPLFQVKMALVLASLLNIAVIRGAAAGAASIVVWTSVILCGRIVAAMT